MSTPTKRTVRKVKWRSGPPPHIGWWNASKFKYSQIWRWWDGKQWSTAVSSADSSPLAADLAKRPAPVQSNIKWNDYWPETCPFPRPVP